MSMTHPPRKILIINIFGVGDVIFTSPLIANLKLHWPQTSLCFLCNERTGELLQHHPHVDQVFVYARDEFRGVYSRSRIEFFKKVLELVGKIRAERFDLAIDLSLNRQINFLTCLSGIRDRIGFDFRGRGCFLTQKIPLRGYEERHVVDYYLDVLRELGIPIIEKSLKVYPGKDDIQYVADILKRFHLDPDKGIVAILPGGGASWGKEATFKRWSAEKFAQLADKIIEKYGLKVILVGDKNEIDLCRQVSGRMRQSAVLVAGETSLLQLSVLLSHCRLAVVNDGGPLHVAVAAGIKTVSIFGPVDERVYGPFPRHDHAVVTNSIVCRPCYRRFRIASCEHHNCLKSIDTDEVFRKVEKLL